MENKRMIGYRNEEISFGDEFLQLSPHKSPDQWVVTGSQKQVPPPTSFLLKKITPANFGEHDEEIINFRKEIKGLIEERVREASNRCSGALQSASTGMAQAIEKYLFRTAPSLEAYADKSTLQSRIHRVATSLVRRRLGRARKSQRQQELRNALGDEMFQQVTSAAQKLRLFRLKKVSEGCACHNSKCSLAPSSVLTMKHQQPVPEAIRAVFFENGLLSALENYYGNRNHLVPQDWSVLVAESQANIQRFQEWEAGNKAEKEQQSLLSGIIDDPSKAEAV